MDKRKSYLIKVIALIAMFVFNNLVSANAVIATNKSGKENEQTIDPNEKAGNWILNQENIDGSWGNKEEIKLYMSSEVFKIYKDNDKFQESQIKAKEKFENTTYKSFVVCSLVTLLIKQTYFRNP